MPDNNRPPSSAKSPKSLLSVTGSCTWPPASPAAPANDGCASTPPGAGPTPSPPPGSVSAPPSPNQQTPVPTTRKTHRPQASPPHPATRASRTHPNPEIAAVQRLPRISTPEPHRREKSGLIRAKSETRPPTQPSGPAHARTHGRGRWQTIASDLAQDVTRRYYYSHSHRCR